MLALAAWLALAPPPDFRPEDIPTVAPEPASTAFYLPRGEAARNAAATVVRPGVRFAVGKGLKLASADDRYSLSLSLRTGVLYSMKRTPDAGAAHGFDLRRLRLLLFGSVFGRHNTYYVQLGLAPRDLDLRDGVVHSSPVLDTYLRFDHLRDLTVTVGQYRVPFSHERNVSDVNPLLIDRSLVNGEFSLDRDIGVGVHSNDLAGLGRLRYYSGVFAGEGREIGHLIDPGFLYVARVDFLPFGLFDDYESSDLPRSRRFRAQFGGAYAFHADARRDRGTLGDPFADGGTMSAHNITADMSLKWCGWSLDAAFHWRRGRRNPGDAVDGDGRPIPVTAPRNGQGWMIQTAFLIPKTRLEPALRWSAARGLGDTSMRDRDELGGGLNYYFVGHNLKLQIDYFHTWDRLAMTEDLLRVQLQLNL
jgi:hypothetical protein